MPIPLDEYPIHQAPLSLRYHTSSDRNVYDRCYLNAHDRTGDVFLVTGLGVYPNLGVIDAYATVRVGDEQHSVHFSDALGEDLMAQRVGGYSIDVVEPLSRLRVRCDGDDHGVGFDLEWQGAFPVVDEAPHTLRTGNRRILDAQRFAQVGSWSGQLRVDGTTFDVTPDVWTGTRDRSWGIRPVGEAEPPGRVAAETPPDYGFWWMYLPIRFDDFALVVIAQEDGAGHRSLNDAVRVWPADSGRAPELLGWPRFTTTYRSGTREPISTLVEMHDDRGEPFAMEVQSLGWVALHCGAGYGGDPDWTHGQWCGRNFAEGLRVDVTDPTVAGRLPFGVLDHVGRARIIGGPHDGRVGWGLYEHASIGCHTTSGFADFFDVAG